MLLCWARPILQLDGEMLQWKWNYGRGATTRPATTTVLANQLSCQFQAKVFDASNCGLRAVVLIKDVSICYCHIKKEVEYVFVKLPAFGAAAIVATQLVASVYSSHVDIVLNNGLRAWDRDSGAITLSPLYGARSLGLSEGCRVYCFSSIQFKHSPSHSKHLSFVKAT